MKNCFSIELRKDIFGDSKWCFCSNSFRFDYHDIIGLGKDNKRYFDTKQELIDRLISLDISLDKVDVKNEKGEIIYGSHILCKKVKI